MADPGDTPVYKLTIQRESPVKGGEPKFTLVPENFTLSGQVPSVGPAPLVVNEPAVVCPSVASSPVFSARTYVKCAVPNCNNYFDGQRSEFMGISYFPFPQDQDLRQEWITAIGLAPDKDPDQLKVCSDHFMNKDFVSDFIEVEDGPEEAGNPGKSRAQETVELKPGVKPSVKLGAEAQQAKIMAEYAMETWEKNMRTYSAKSKKGGGKSGNFVGLDNPFMDTANEQRSSSNASVASSQLGSMGSEDEPCTVDSEVPVITSVGTIFPLNSDALAGNKTQKELDRERANALGTLVDVVEVQDEEDDMLEEMMAQSSAGLARKTLITREVIPENNEETNEALQGLINVPASVKLPPRKTITGDSSTSVPTKSPESPAVSSTVDSAVPSTSDNVMPHTAGPSDRSGRLLRPRRKRCTREEMQRREEEDEWEPTIWSKKTLAKQGYEFEPKRRGQKHKFSTKAPKNRESSDDDIFELDEGFRIDEPIATRSQSSSTEKRRRPGPASKTSRPQYVTPASDQAEGEPKLPSSENLPENSAAKGDLEEVLADKSLLVEWAFFKSLLPDLGRMSRQKRDELKTFMLDTLNARIYEGKPIQPISNCTDPVEIEL